MCSDMLLALAQVSKSIYERTVRDGYYIPIRIHFHCSNVDHECEVDPFDYHMWMSDAQSAVVVLSAIEDGLVDTNGCVTQKGADFVLSNSNMMSIDEVRRWFEPVSQSDQ